MLFDPELNPLDDALEYLIFEDVTKEKDSDDWDDAFDEESD